MMCVMSLDEIYLETVTRLSIKLMIFLIKDDLREKDGPGPGPLH